MDIPDVNKVKDVVKNASQTEVGKEVVDAVAGVAHGKLHDARNLAAAKGLGGVFDAMENMAEKQMGVDLDGDGDTGK